jgi:DNA-binding FadR family transcriptional regulator
MSQALDQELDRVPGELVFRPIRSRNLFEETVERLGQAIRLGVVPLDERFPPERELAEQLGVSRVTVREAIRALEKAGLVAIRQGRHGGTYVIASEEKPSKGRARRMAKELGTELQDALDLRWAIEPAIAELAAQRRADDDLARGEELLQEAAMAPHVPRVLRAGDSRFHLALADMAGSASLAAAAADMQVRLGELLLTLPVLDESISHSQAQHAEILGAVAERDGERARAAMLEHLSATAQLLRGLS